MKKKLINNLEECIYCRLKPSKIHGIGVFAIKDIPPNTNPFRHTYNKSCKYDVIILNNNDIKNVDNEVKKMLKDFCKNGNKYDVLLNGLNAIDISFYLNHSKNPNLEIYEDKNCDYYAFKTMRLIQKDEELLINYDIYINKK